MAYYTALITAWNGATQPPSGVTGTPLTGGMTTAQKIAAVNGWTIVGSAPATFYITGTQILNCMNWAEFNALTATQQSNLLALCSTPGGLIGGSAQTAQMAAGMILAYFSNHAGPTVAALTALASAVVQPWWQVTAANGGGGLSSPIGVADLVAAGGLT